jgi:RNA-binding protein YlmH
MDIYQHFRKEEEPFIDQVLSWKEKVERTYIPKLSDFLDPREQQIAQMIVGTNNTDLRTEAFGGSPHAERKRLIIAPFYEEITEESYQLSLLEAAYPVKFVTLEHRDVMGAFLSLGIKREKLGDIFVTDGLVQIFTASEISSYVMMNLTSIKQANIKLSETELDKALMPAPNWTESSKTVSSLRLDTVLKEIYRVSRKDAQQAIEKNLVKVNHQVVEDNKFSLEPGDLISYRGKGRSKIVRVEGQTKKDKWRIVTAVLN